MRRTRHSCTIRPLYSTGGLGYQSYLWLRVITAHLKCRDTAQDRQENRKRPINDGGAPIKSDKSDRSDMSDQAPHQTLRQNQTAIQYWGAGLSVIPLIASDYRSPQVPGTAPTRQANRKRPINDGGAPTESVNVRFSL